jgi:hypothetical protein
MDIKRKVLISTLAAAPLLGGGAIGWAVATAPSAGAQTVPVTTHTSDQADLPGDGSALLDPAGTSAATEVQTGTQLGGTGGTTAGGTTAGGTTAGGTTAGGTEDAGGAAAGGR